MDARAWKNAIGEDAYNHMVKILLDGTHPNDLDPDSRTATAILPVEEDRLATILTAAFEVGFVPPAAKPQVNPQGTRVMFPGAHAALTGAGLAEYWRAKGHGWVIFRCDQLARALAGPHLIRMQEIAASYEQQCEFDGIGELEMVPAGSRVFVGGTTKAVPRREIGDAIIAGAPIVSKTIEQTRKGPDLK